MELAVITMRTAYSEIPIVLSHVLLATHRVRRSRAREEVMSLRTKCQRRQDRGVYLSRFLREDHVESKIHERLVRVVVEECLDIFCQPQRIVDRSEEHTSELQSRF